MSDSNLFARRWIIDKRRGGRPFPEEQHRVNRRIKRSEVRVINQDGQQLGVMPIAEAMRIAEAGGLDLVEVNPKVNPPVCKIMDYGRFKYEKAKQAKAARKHQTTIMVKELKLRPKTDVHDLNVKIKRVSKFLDAGHKVKLMVLFRGREIVHPETGQMILQRLVDAVGDKLVIEQMPVMEGRRMVMLVAPAGGGRGGKPQQSRSQSPPEKDATTQQTPEKDATTQQTPDKDATTQQTPS